MRETRAWALIAAALFAVVFYNFVWVVYPSCSWCRLELRDVSAWVSLLLAPILLFVWSLIAYRRSQTYRWARRAVIAHALGCAALVALMTTGPWVPVGTGWAVIAVLGLLVDGLVLGLSPPAAASPPVLGFYARSIALGGGGAILALLAWSLASAVLVSQHAVALSQDRPYCIQVASSGRGTYAEATSLHALSGLRMQTPYTMGGSSDFQFAFHAVLVIENNGRLEYYNWSYRSGQFVPISERTLRALYLLRPSCAARVNFVRQLSWL